MKFNQEAESIIVDVINGRVLPSPTIPSESTTLPMLSKQLKAGKIGN
jgi:hypothetical protein